MCGTLQTARGTRVTSNQRPSSHVSSHITSSQFANYQTPSLSVECYRRVIQKNANDADTTELLTAMFALYAVGSNGGK